MSSCIDPDTYNEKLLAAEMANCKIAIKKAYDVLMLTQRIKADVLWACNDDELGLQAKAKWTEKAKKAEEDYEAIFNTMSCWVHRVDFINAALSANKTDHEIQTMLVPVNECTTEHGSVAVLKGLVVALGGTITDMGPEAKINSLFGVAT